MPLVLETIINLALTFANIGIWITTFTLCIWHKKYLHLLYNLLLAACIINFIKVLNNTILLLPLNPSGHTVISICFCAYFFKEHRNTFLPICFFLIANFYGMILYEYHTLLDILSGVSIGIILTYIKRTYVLIMWLMLSISLGIGIFYAENITKLVISFAGFFILDTTFSHLQKLNKAV